MTERMERMEHIGKIVGQAESAANSETTQKKELPKKWIAAIFQKFQAIYLHRFTSSIDGIETVVMKEWAKELGCLTGEQIKLGLERLPDDWPPTSKEFRRLCQHEVSNPSFKPFAPALPRPEIEPEYVESQLAEMREILK